MTGGPILPRLHPTVIFLGALVVLVAAIEFWLSEWSSWPRSGNTSEIVTAIATIAVVVAAFIQLREIRWNQQRWATLQACDRYDIDPMLDKTKTIIRRLRFGATDIEEHDVEAATLNLLNYFDAIAIGVKQGLYLEEIVADHLGNIMRHALEFFRSSRHPQIISVMENFEHDFATFAKFARKHQLG